MANQELRPKIEGSMTSSGKVNVRFGLEVSPELVTALDQLAEESKSTRSEVLLKAVALYQVAMEANRKGNRVAIVDSNGNVVTDIIGLQRNS